MRTSRKAMCVTALLLGGISGCDKDKTSDAAKAQANEAAADAPAKNAAANKEDALSSVPSALSHLPSSCQVVFSLDLKKAQNDPLVAKHLKFPDPKELASDREKAGKDELAAQMAMKALGINSPKQLHQIAACITAIDQKTGEPQAYSLAIGGEFKKGADLDAVAQTAGGSLSGKRSEVKLGSIEAIKNEKEGLLFAQAKDGVILIASDESLLKKSYESSEAYKAYELSDEHHLSLLVNAKVAQTAAAAGGPNSPFAQINPGDIRLHGSLSGQVSGQVAMKSPEEATQAAAALVILKTQFAAHPDPTMKTLAGAISVKADGNALKLDIKLPEEMTIKMLESYSQLSEDVQKEAK